MCHPNFGPLDWLAVFVSEAHMKMKLRKRVLELRPTQFAVGMLEVDEKIKSFRRLTRVEQRNYVRDNPVPVVLSPDGSMYVYYTPTHWRHPV
ncbi:MAG: hypothetical protein EOP04_27850 [Proteobacteria bacterium]|nr:MAG: hypothetical protein EOP04_27850 [Pseudomonadota bacterium]